MQRNLTLDIMRTLAIVLMVIFHFIYDLTFFGYASWDIPDGSGWREFRWVIISLFFICLGISLSFVHKSSFKSKKFLKRLGQISLAALLISVFTYIAIPKNWIFFGVLHFLALASCIVVFFVRLPKVCLLISICFLSVGAMQILPSRWPFDLFFDNLPRYTNDYVALFPWLGMVFLGVVIAHSTWFLADPCLKHIDQNKVSAKYLVWPGQHSLSIYLLHQPVLMGLVYLSTKI